MDFDHTYNGPVDWNFPSPGATPNNYHHHAFNTPKTATFTSHFQDAFSTPHIPSYTPTQADLATMAQLQRPPPSSNPSRPHHYTYMQSSGASYAAQSMMPPSQPAYQMHAMNQTYPHSQSTSMQPAPAMNYDTSQIQTPPPTRDNAIKKSHNQHVAFGSPSTIISRKMMQQAAEQNQHHQTMNLASMQYLATNSAAALYPFGNYEPAPADSTLTNNQPLWDDARNSNAYRQQPPVLDDPFNPTSSMSMQWSPLPHQMTAPLLAFDTPAMTGFSIQTSVQRSRSTAQSSRAYMRPLTTNSVDPSLVYSSPIKPVMDLVTDQVFDRSTGIYDSNLCSGVRRRGSGDALKQKGGNSRTDAATASRSAPTAGSNPTPTKRLPLQRSNTIAHITPRKSQTTNPGEFLNRSGGQLKVPRTSSPLKRVGRSNLRSISESRRPRSSVILTVDESGRARAVRTDASGAATSPNKVMRDRYPGLYDSDSSEGESDGENTPSKSLSFSFDRCEERQSKVARLDPPVENLDGLSIPRSSSVISTKVTPSRAAIAAAAQLRRGNSNRKQTVSRNGPRRAANPVASIDTAPMNVPQDGSQSFIGFDDFNRGLTLSSGDSLHAQSQCWNMSSTSTEHSPTYVHDLDHEHFLQHDTKPRVQAQRLIRCKCGNNRERGHMVQCSSCTQWLHGSCVDLQPGATPPPGFTCFLCTRPTSRIPPSTTK